MRIPAEAVPLLVAIVVMAGCVEAAESPRTVTEEVEGSDVNLRVSVTSQGRQHRLDAEATNVGLRTLYVSTICAPVFTDEVRRGADRVWPPPEAVCLAYGVGPMAPGASVSHASWWNQTRHQDPDRTRTAAAGEYTWVASFHYQEEEDGPWRQVTGRVPVTVR